MKINYEFIDESVRELVRILNAKNYITISSCSGYQPEHEHFVENRLQIAFRHPYTDIVFPDEISNVSYDENTLYIDYIGESDEDIKRVIKQWTEHFKAHPIHKIEVKVYSYSIIVITKNGRQLYLTTTYSRDEAFSKMKELKNKGKYRSIKLKRTPIEKW